MAEVEEVIEPARMQLLDLLIGQYFRRCAWEMFECALEIERFPLVSDLWLQKAAHAEWIAVRAERGQIGWGARINRCDQWQRDDESSA